MTRSKDIFIVVSNTSLSHKEIKRRYEDWVEELKSVD